MLLLAEMVLGRVRRMRVTVVAIAIADVVARDVRMTVGMAVTLLVRGDAHRPPRSEQHTAEHHSR